MRTHIYRRSATLLELKDAKYFRPVTKMGPRLGVNFLSTVALVAIKSDDRYHVYRHRVVLPNNTRRIRLGSFEWWSSRQDN